LLFAVPFESVKNLSAGGLNVTVTNLIAFCVAGSWLAWCATQGRITRGPTPWLSALLIYGLVMAISISQATSFAGSIKEMLKWGQMVFVYIVGVTMVRTRADLRRLLIVLLVAVLAEAMVGAAQTILHAGPSSFARGGFLRAAGTFDQPNPFAGYLNMTFPLAVALLAYRAFPRAPMWLVVAATGGSILVSLSRGALLASICALVVMAALAMPRSRPLIGFGIVVLGIILVGGGIGLVPSSVSNSLAQQFGVANLDVANPSPDNWAVTERLAHMEAGLAMFANHPILGVGIGNYAAVYGKYRVADVWQDPLGHAHNYYINIAAEAGIIGLAAFAFLLVSALVICVRAFRRARTALERAVGLGCLGVVVTIVIHSFFDDVFVHSMEVQWAIVMVAASRVAAGFVEDQPVEHVP
jgi:O-antigen ligase